MNELVIVVDFGAQYSQLIARRIREHNVYCEVVPYTADLDKLLARKPIGIVLSGGPNSVYEENSPSINPKVFSCGIPVLGICYGCQLMVHSLGGVVSPADTSIAREYGRTETSFNPDCPIFKGIPEKSITWMSHGDFVSQLPAGFKNAAHTDHCYNAAIYNEKERLYGLQFHPEVNHTEYGKDILAHFLDDICHAKHDWIIADFLKEKIASLRAEIGDRRILLALSGGVDSTITAVLLNKAVGKNLTCVYVDTGLMRKNESDQISEYYHSIHLNFIRVDAKDIFLEALKGVTEPEEKRHIIGAKFIDVFTDTSNKLGEIPFFAQGTIYPDVIESGSANGNKIKSHHNVGGLPEHIKFEKIIEPLRVLFKDEVRKLGLEMGVPDRLVYRQPFPGPGLAVRILGEITEEKVKIEQDADAIFREVIEKYGWDKKISQYFTVLTNIRSVGVMGDHRTYSYVLALRAVNTEDFMTASYTRIPYEILDEASRRIVNEVSGINRVVYDITNKPPSTVEFE